MNRSGRLVLVGLVFVVAAGCAGLMMTPVTGPAQRFELPGLSVMSPSGRDWYVDGGHRTQVQIIFAKKLETDWRLVPTVRASAVVGENATLATSAEEVIEAKQRAVERLRRQGGRFSPVLRKLVVDRTPGAECVRWEQEDEERDNPQPALREHVLVTVSRGFLCLHPHSRRLSVAFSYSERRIRGTPSLLDTNQALVSEGESFLRSISFKPL